MSRHREEQAPGAFNLVDLELARLLAMRAGAHSGNLALAAALASHQRRLGHPCLLLGEWAGKEHGLASSTELDQGSRLPQQCPALDEWVDDLRTSGVVAIAPEQAAAFPLVLEDGRLYLQRMHAAEQRVAQALMQRWPLMPLPGCLPALLERIAPEADTDAGQRQAVRNCFGRRLHVLTGGPGTGKTSTVGRVLALALALQPTLRVHLAAPTGKAAARLQEALGQSLKWLPQDMRETLEALPRATTLHQLLHAAPPVDLLVVDEASMVDLSLMDRVLAFLPDNARLLLVGDANQLASVDAGAVLHQVVEGLQRLPAEACAGVTHLERSRRFNADSGIGLLAQAVGVGNADSAVQALKGNHGDVEWVRIQAQDAGPAFTAHLEAGLESFCRSQDAQSALDALESFRVVCARRNGRVGVEAINQWCRRRYVESGAVPFSPLLIRQNDHVLGLANGDSGVRAQGKAGEANCYLQQGRAGLRCLKEAQLPPHDDAWAITVHQSQGSEADTILLVMPEESSPLLCRELLYTGLTRARRRLIIVGSETALRKAASTPTVRTGGLAARLQQVAVGPSSGALA